MKSRELMGRREFLRSSGRYSVLGGLAVVLAVLGIRARNAGATCELRSVCGACPRFSGCELPKVEEARSASVRNFTKEERS